MKRFKPKSHSGIVNRWSLGSVILVGIFLCAVIVCLTILTSHLAHQSIERSLDARAEEIVRLYQETDDPKVFSQGYEDGGEIQSVLMNTDGTALAVSGGGSADPLAGAEFSRILKSEDGIYRGGGYREDGTHVATAGRKLYYGGQFSGAVWCSMPTGGAAGTVAAVCLSMVGGGILLLIIMLWFSRRVARSVVAPVKDISFTANKIAQGDFNIRLDKVRDDEIGELVDSINDMAVSLDTTENMKNEFISSVSHELRTPLTAIKGWAETMQSGEIDQQTFDRGMGVIVREAERLSGIVEELLDFSRMQNGKMKTHMQRTELLEELNSAVYLFSDRAKAEGKFLLYEPPKSLPDIYGDVNRLRQVFVNIIDNALKYTDEGGTINVSAKADRDFIRVTIADNGCGIPAEHLPNVRRKFYKANQTVRGSGIGLALADEIVALHAGTLDIESHENLGTAVTITLPTFENLERHKAKMHG